MDRRAKGARPPDESEWIKIAEASWLFSSPSKASVVVVEGGAPR